jgi:hypothetical protein
MTSFSLSFFPPSQVMMAQGPYSSISAFDRGDDYDEYGVIIAYVFAHPEVLILFTFLTFTTEFAYFTCGGFIYRPRVRPP